MSDTNGSSAIDIKYCEEILTAPESTEKEKTEFVDSIIDWCKQDDAKKKETK